MLHEDNVWDNAQLWRCGVWGLEWCNPGLRGCSGFMCPGFGSGGAAGVVSVRTCWKLLLCLREPVPASSMPDPSAVVAVTVGNRFKMKLLQRSDCSWREEWGYVRGTAQCAARSVSKEREEVPQLMEQRFPCSLLCRPWCGSCSSAAHGGLWGTHLQPGEDQEAEGCPEEGVAPWRACAGAGFLAELVASWRTHAGAIYSWRTAPYGRDPCWSSLCKNGSLWKGPMLEKIMEECVPWERHCVGVWEENQKKEVMETMWNGQMAAPIPWPSS